MHDENPPDRCPSRCRFRFRRRTGVRRRSRRVPRQVRAELVQLAQAGYRPGRANDPHYPDDLQAALTRIHASPAVAADTSASGYGSDAAAVTQSGSRPATRIAERSIYFGH